MLYVSSALMIDLAAESFVPDDACKVNVCAKQTTHRCTTNEIQSLPLSLIPTNVGVLVIKSNPNDQLVGLLNGRDWIRKVSRYRGVLSLVDEGGVT